MDRRLLLGLIAFLLTIGGCSRSNAPPNTAAAVRQEEKATAPVGKIRTGGLTGSGSGGGGTGLNSGAESSTDDAQRAALALERERQELYRRRSEYEFKETQVEGALEKPSSDLAGGQSSPTPGVLHGVNPFRDLAPPSSPPGEETNPLRAVARQPRMATPRSHGARAEPPPPPIGLSPPSVPLSEPMAPAVDVAPVPSSPLGARDYDVVEVFYGTDRQASDAAPSNWLHLLHYFWPAGGSALVTLCLALIATARRSLVWGLLAFGGVGVSFGFAYQGTSLAIAAVRHAGKGGPQYTTDRSAGGRIDFGMCQITLPRKHVAGELESPSLTRLELLEDASKHVVLQNTERLASPRFYELLRRRVDQSARRELFVFVHGFNVSFEDAARRTAQIHYDLQFDGAPLFFSWPAHDKFIFTYPADETNVAWSVPHLKRFLLEIVKESGARSINLIAHSMGNRGLAAALREIELEMHERARLFNQVILAAPDIDADEFRTSIAPAMQRTAHRLTLYASARDDALLASRFVHHGPRAGDAGEGLVVVPGVDTIDVTAIDTSPWGHSYYGSSDPVLHDLRELFSRAVPPRDRTWLSPAERDGLTYWIFQPIRTAAADSDATR